MHGAPDAFEAELLGAIEGLRADALSLTHDPFLSEDLVQETLMRAWRARENYARDARMRRWLFVILRNCALNERQKRRTEARAIRTNAPSAGTGPYNPLARLILADATACYPRLSGSYRQAMDLVVGQGLNYEVAAERIGCSVNTLKSRVRRARRDLLRLLDGAPLRRGYKPLSTRRSKALATSAALSGAAPRE